MSAVIVDPQDWPAFQVLIVQEFLADLLLKLQGDEGVDETIQALQHFDDQAGSRPAIELDHLDRIPNGTLDELIEIFRGFESNSDGLGSFCRTVLDAFAGERDQRQSDLRLPEGVTRASTH